MPTDALARFTDGHVDLACFEVDGRTYALDVAQVREIVRCQPVTPLPKAPALIEGVINLRGTIVPVLDRELVRLAASLDSRAVANRTGQDRMLLRFHPEIADIPHVMENGDPARALRASPWGVAGGGRGAGVRRHASIPRPDDRRFVCGNTAFGNPGWRRARRAVEPMRPLVRRLFADGPFDAYWPPPDGRPRRVDFASQQGPKLLLGLALWLSREGAPEPP